MTTPSAVERHTQTILALLLVGLLSWVGLTTHQTSVLVAQLSIQVSFLQNGVDNDFEKFNEIERRLDSIEQTLNRLRDE